MKKITIVIDEDTLEATLKEVEENETSSQEEELSKLFTKALGCDKDELYDAYITYKKAEEKFKQLYDPAKKNLIELYQNNSELPKSLIVDGIKLTYISPSTRTTIDSKKLKEEEPEIAKKFTKTSEISATIRLDELF